MNAHEPVRLPRRTPGASRYRGVASVPVGSWRYHPTVGLQPTPVDLDVLHQVVMALRNMR